MDRAALIAAAKAKYEREQLIAAAKAKAAAEANAPTVDEAADVAASDRVIAKNFANSPEAQMRYLQQQYPDAQVKLVDGEVAIKMKGDTSYKKLDPSFSPLSNPLQTLKDLPADVGDILYDTAAGIGQSAATLGGATLGALAGPLGAFAGGAAASGTTAATAEGFRQKLGQALGIPQEVDGKDVAMAGAFGTVSPMLFGAGKLGPQAIAKYAAANNITKEAAEEALTKGTKGLTSAAYDYGKQKVFPKVGEMMSGVKSDVIRAYAKNMDKVDELEAGGVSSYLDKLTGKVQDTLAAEKTKLGKEIAQKLQEAKTPIDIKTARDNWWNKIQEQQAMAETEADDEIVDEMIRLHRKYFDGLGDSVDGLKSLDVRQKLGVAAQWEKDASDAIKYAKMNGPRAAVKDISAAEEAAVQGIQDAKNKYANQLEIDDMLSSKFKDSQTTYNTVTGLNAKSKKVMAEKLKELATDGKLDIGNEIEILQAYNAFADPSLVPVGLQGATSTSRSIPLSIGGASLGSLLGYKMGGGYAGAAIGGLVGAKIGNYAGSPAMIKRAIKGTKALEQATKRAEPLLMPKGANLLNPAATNTLPLLMWKPEEDEQY